MDIAFLTSARTRLIWSHRQSSSHDGWFWSFELKLRLCSPNSIQHQPWLWRRVQLKSSGEPVNMHSQLNSGTFCTSHGLPQCNVGEQIQESNGCSSCESCSCANGEQQTTPVRLSRPFSLFHEERTPLYSRQIISEDQTPTTTTTIITRLSPPSINTGFPRR